MPDAIEAEAEDAKRIERGLASTLQREIESLEAIAPGLDVRRFYRIHLAGEKAPARLIARVSPEAAQPPDCEPVRALFAVHGLPVPAAYGAAGGIEFLEDLGDASLETLAREGPARRRDALYAEACALVPAMQAIAFPSRRRLDANLVALKAEKWLEWTLPHALGREAREPERSATLRAFGFIAEVCAAAPQRLAHRDFKAANLLLRPATGDEPPRLCMIDLQGAFLAPPEYDLVCLLRDAHVDLAEDRVQDHLERTRPALPDAPRGRAFQRRFDLITVARVAKDISHYLHAAASRGDRRYLPFVPSGLANLRAASGRAAERDGEIGDFAEIVGRLPDSIAVSPDSPAEGQT